MHLAGVRQHRQILRRRHRPDFARLGDAADAVHVGLQDIHRFAPDQIAESVARELVLGADVAADVAIEDLVGIVGADSRRTS